MPNFKDAYEGLPGNVKPQVFEVIKKICDWSKTTFYKRLKEEVCTCSMAERRVIAEIFNEYYPGITIDDLFTQKS
jgi:hypothetical protein